MKKREFITKNARETQKLAGEILEDALGVENRKTAAVLALQGELGGGKTTFTQGLAQALGVKEKITSPTFVILRRFKIYDLRFTNLYHIDCYRLNSSNELTGLGFDEIIKDPKNLIVIEWADKVESLIPSDAVWLEFEWEGEEERKISLVGEITE
jgi:tRNA threonylcarbamoyladenosine biosynthesis protein TsaE